MKKTTLKKAYSSYCKKIDSWQRIFFLFFAMIAVQFTFAQVAIIENLNGTTLPTGWTSTSFFSTTDVPCEGSGAFRANLWAFTTAASVTTSNYVGVSNGTNITVNFMWKTTEYSAGSGVGLSANVEYSTNDGTTWLPAGPAITSSAITTCAMYSSTISGAAVPMNSDFKFRISAAQTSGDYYFYLDQFSITQATSVAPQCATIIAPANGAVDISSSVLTWTSAPGIPTGYLLSVGTTPGGSELVNAVNVGNVTTYNLGPLASSTMYYVRITPYNANGNATGCTETSFTTCGAVTTLPWTENFDSMPTTGNVFPGCWFMENGAWLTGNAASNTYTDPRSGTNYLYNNWGAVNEYVWTKGFSLTASTSYDFSTFVQGDNGNTWVVDMFVNNTQSSIGATQMGGSYNVLGTGFPYTAQPYMEMRRTFVPTTTGIYYFAVRVNEPTSGPWYLGFDDFRVELSPSCVPPMGLSATNALLTSATINWSASTSTPANGYQYYYSTTNTAPADSATPSGSTAAGVTTDGLTGLTANSTYYFWVRSVCDATTSSAWGGPGTFYTGYCQSNPTSNDNLGITNVQLGTTNFPTADLVYFYHSTPVVNLAQGINTNVQVSFATGYTYMTTIWIDFNDNLIFDASEQVFTGVSAATNPTIFNASFVMPAGAALGQHRMRMQAQDNELATPDPCYSGAYGVTLDFEVNIVAASCTPPAATTSITADCGNNQYFVAVNVTSLGSGSPTITYGTTTVPVTAVGTIQVGPFAVGSSQTLTLNHGSDATCNVALGNFTYVCPPANDNCANAVSLTVNPDLACGTVTAGTTVGATLSMAATPCFGNPDDDVWYSFVATATAHQVSLLNVVAVTGTSTDMYFQVLSGACGSQTSVICSDPNSNIATGLTVGSTYYVRVYSYGNTSFQNFNICIGTFPPAPVNDNCANAVALTVNPDLACGTVTAGTTLSATLSMAATPCFGNPDDDVWYSFVATATSHQVSLLNVVAVSGTSTDMYFQVLSGACGSQTSVICSDPNTNIASGLTIGNTYYVRVYSYGATSFQNFNICIGTLPLPPANDECVNAIALTAGATFATNPYDATNSGATGSSQANPATCFGYSGGDVWFTVVVPASGNITVQTGDSTTGDSGVDTVITLYSGSCGSLNQVGCNDDNGGAYSLVSLTGQTPGAVIYIRAYEYNNDNTGIFAISAYDASLSTNSFDNASFAYYPNPVKDVLNLSYDKNITAVSVFNLLGQQVISKQLNATNGQLDMSNLASGAYIVKVTSENSTKSIKVIKE